MKKQTIAFIILMGVCLNLYYPIFYLPSNSNQSQNASDNYFDTFENEISVDQPQLDKFDENHIPNDIRPAISNLLEEIDPTLPNDYDIGKVLADRDNDLTTINEPWKSKAAIHALSFHEETGFLALAGGYLYDNEIHIYRLNVETEEFDKVWDSGDGIIQSDVISLDFGDTDLNDFLEIVAASADGHIYVFEQSHIYDPFTNMENRFEHVWTSPAMFRVFGVKVDDVDRDYRPDIIAGTWDGLFLYEYDDHSGYPFVEEHWITYECVWNYTDFNREKIYSLESGDTNENGLPEIIVGTREGTVYVFENGGITAIVNGQPFPLIRDNFYELKWTSENYTWTPIRSMAIGEIDGTPGDELAIIAQGQGLLTLDWNDAEQTYDYKKVVRDFQSWETFGYWKLDHYVDRMISANNVTYYDPLNSSIIAPEPINYVRIGGMWVPDADVYPYNTGLAMWSDGNASTFDASLPGVDNATAVVDFGQDEEGTGSANDRYDLIVRFVENVPSDVSNYFNFSVSQNGGDFEQISGNRFTPVGKELRIDVDDALSRRKWDWFQYAKISVFNGANYSIDNIELVQVYNLLTDGLSVEIGPMRLDGELYFTEETELDKIIVGTVTGKYVVVAYNDEDDLYQIQWDSGTDERYTAGTGIWDMVYLSSVTAHVPIWRMLYPPNPNFAWPLLKTSMGEYNSWTWSTLYPLGTYANDGNFLIGTKNGKIQALNALGDEDPAIDLLLTDINGHYLFRDDNHLSVEAPWIYHPMFNFLPSIAVSSYNPDAPLDGNFLEDPRADLKFFYRAGTTQSSLFEPVPISIEDLDATGEIQALFAVAKYQPKTTFTDIDDDGDMDMIFTNGQLYLAKNLFMEDGGNAETPLRFALVRDYFKDVNDALTKGGWGQPDLWDLDQDGTLDLVLNFADKNGTTAFLNEGDMMNPIWEENERIFWNWNIDRNIKLLNLTDTRILSINDGLSLDLYADLYDFEMNEDFVMVSYNSITNYTWWAEPVYDGIDSYMVATYPEVKWTDFSLMQSDNYDYWNFGFNVRESWSTEDDLEQWTLSIASGDTDQDGKGEIIVGDYDNNVYVFENLVNNTYKRMYRTFDIRHNETSSSSPYLYDELEGISGEFSRMIWDHAEHLIADVDLDQDGLKEIVIASSLQIYVFEDKNLTGGDELQFIYSMDLRDVADGYFAEHETWTFVDKITAMTEAYDLDYDNRNELVIAAGPYLFVFNVGPNYQDTIDNGFFVTNGNLEGRYDLLGNPLAKSDWVYAVINALAYGDTDQDGFREIILGGTKDTRNIKDDGFVYIYECHGGTFLKAWEAGIELTEWNPITDIVIDDQDFDGAEEIIIGHHYGIDIWEWVLNSDNTYEKREIITSSPNYPHVPLIPMGNTFLNEFERNFADIANGLGTMDDTIMTVYSNYSRLWYSIYDENSGVWSAGKQLTPAGYDGFTENDIRLEKTPSVCAVDNGRYYAVWKMEPTSGLANGKIYASYYNPVSETWTTPVAQTNPGFGDDVFYPDIAPYDDSNMVITMTWDQTATLGRRGLYHKVTANNLPGIFTKQTEITFPKFEQMYIHSSSMHKTLDGEFVIAFSAINYNISKPDYDIWTIRLNGSFDYSKTVYHQVTNSYNDELYPNLAQLNSEDESLVVIYENMQSPYEDRLGISSSQDGSKTWSRPYTLNVIIPGLDRVEFPDLGYVGYYSGVNPILNPMYYGACIAGLNDGGFIYNLQWTAPIYEIAPGDFSFWVAGQYYGINPESDWTGHHLLNTEDLDVGDTDGDGRQEIAIGWEHQVSVYELKSSYDGDLATQEMIYTEEWLSETFENPFTALTVYDSKGNGFDEVAIATERGDVYFKEFLDPSKGSIQMMNADEILKTKTYTYPDPTTLYVEDMNNDGIEEIVALSDDDGNETLIVYYQNGTIMWSKPYFHGYTTSTELVDLNGDKIKDIIIAKEFGGSAYAINGFTGEELWNITGYYFYSMIAADYDFDGKTEIFFGGNSHYIHVFNQTGHQIDNFTLPTGNTYSMGFGNFTGGENLTLAVVDSQGYLRVVHPHNGSVIFESGIDFAYKSSEFMVPLVPYDFTNDGIDELVFMSDRLHILDVIAESIIYNSTYYGDTYTNIFIDNFDNDDDPEIITQTRNQGIFMEDFVAKSTLWNYNPNGGEIADIAIGNRANNSGKFIAGIKREGTIFALDGKSGLVLWFNDLPDTGALKCAVATLSMSPYHQDVVVGWTSDGTLAIYTGENPTKTIEDPQFVKRDVFYEIPTGGSVSKLYVEDITQNGIDDIIWIKNYDELIVWDTEAGKELLSYQHTTGIQFVRFGNLTGEGNYDFALVDTDNTVLLFDGDTGKNFTNIYLPHKDHYVQEMLINEFDNAKDNDEVIVLYEKTIGLDNAVITWYTNKGEWMYNSQTNGTYAYNTLITGHFTSANSNDLAMAYGLGQILIFYGGNNGLLYNNPTFATTIYNMIPADTDGDNIDEIVSMNSGYDIYITEPTGTSVQIANYDNGKVWDLTAADIVNADGAEEVYVNVESLGIRGHDGLGGGIPWQFNAPMKLPSYYSKILIADHDDDGTPDIAYQNYNYLNVLDGATQDLKWHYYSDVALTLLEIGRFEKTDSPLGAVYLDNQTIVIVSGEETSIDPPGYSYTPISPTLTKDLLTPKWVWIGIAGLGLGVIYIIVVHLKMRKE